MVLKGINKLFGNDLKIYNIYFKGGRSYYKAINLLSCFRTIIIFSSGYSLV